MVKIPLLRLSYQLSTIMMLPLVSLFRQYRCHTDTSQPLISNYPWEQGQPYVRLQSCYPAVSHIVSERLYYGLITENKYKLGEIHKGFIDSFVAIIGEDKFVCTRKNLTVCQCSKCLFPVVDKLE